MSQDFSKSGDRIISKQPSGVYAIHDHNGAILRDGIANLDRAHEAARSGLDGGRLWFRDWCKPRVLERY